MTPPADQPGENRRAPRYTYLLGAHNSVGVIEDTLEELVKRLSDVPSEIIVVENGSTDQTVTRLAEISAAWPDEGPSLTVISSTRGLGSALRAGIAASSGEVIVVTADDLPFGFDDLDAAEGMDTANCVVIGSKGHRDSSIERSVVRTVLSSGHRMLRFLALGLRTADSQGSFVLPGPWARGLAPALRETGFLITTEIAYAADLAGLPLVEVPVRLRKTTHSTRVRMSDVRTMGLGLVGIRRRRSALRAAATRSLAAPPAGHRAGQAPCG